MNSLLPHTGIWLFPEAPAPQLVEVIQEAEAVGLDELWLGDEGPAREPFSVLSAAAVKTSQILLGVGITNPYVRTPGLAASSMLTVHELSGGRALLGVGAGGQMSLNPFGLEAVAPARETERFIDIARAVAQGRSTDGYHHQDHAITEADAGSPMPIYVGGRGPRLNTLASAKADGAFVAGMPPFRYDEVIGWARSERPIDIALYPSVAFDEEAIEHHRPEMIWALLDAPPDTASALGLDQAELAAAAEELRSGNAETARKLMTDNVLQEVMLVGDPKTVGARLKELHDTYKPASIGLALLQPNLQAGIDDAVKAFSFMADGLVNS